MTNPNDPRTPQERAYPHDEPGDDETRVLHTDDPTEAYGRPVTNPTLAYPQYDPRFDSAAPPPNPTQQLGEPLGQYPQGRQPAAQYPTAQYPTVQDSQAQYPQGQYPTAGYPGGGYQPPGPPPPGYGEPGYGQPAEPEKKPRGPRWGVLALAVIVLIALGGIVGYLLSGSGDEPDSSATGPTTTQALPPAPTTTPSPVPAPGGAAPDLPLDELPGGLGEVLGQTGAVVGSITANDGTSITLSGIGGSLTTVLFTPETQIITLRGSSPEALEIGATVVATGSPVENGQMTAETVISASLPSFGSPGN
ncbi:hypothetical protein EV641_11698 [Rhodococcus sp. SMB37]|uniref:hypothetical protein n=1 Tax=Rhodococcus sp. SMB37 TaxID=2512213 RepID=UPI00104B43A9|nr:hypothetical protein [Rhodococcus sp. SMB37]TCN49249.1 hypothetical protein EV641_11698 [Rhodococcus sp. SMB37]